MQHIELKSKMLQIELNKMQQIELKSRRLQTEQKSKRQQIKQIFSYFPLVRLDESVVKIGPRNGKPQTPRHLLELFQRAAAWKMALKECHMQKP